MAEVRLPESNPTRGHNQRSLLQHKVLPENVQVDSETRPGIDNSLLSELCQLSSSAEQLISRLTCYQLLPQLLREIVIDRALNEWENAAISQANDQQNQVDLLRQQALETLTQRKLKIQKFKQAMWGAKLESYFLSRKRNFDRVVYSLLRTPEPELAQELYFRIQAGEQSFADLAQTYSQGPEALTNGLVGPVELSTLHPDLARLLAVSQLGQLWSPKPFGELWVIVRLERILPAQLNEFMRQRLLNELFEAWLQKQLHELPEADQQWLKLAVH